MVFVFDLVLVVFDPFLAALLDLAAQAIEQV